MIQRLVLIPVVFGGVFGDPLSFLAALQSAMEIILISIRPCGLYFVVLSVETKQ